MDYMLNFCEIKKEWWVLNCFAFATQSNTFSSNIMLEIQIEVSKEIETLTK